MWGAIAAAGAGALLGGLGNNGNSSTQTTLRDVGQQSGLAKAGGDASKLSLEELLRQLKLGPGDESVQGGFQSQQNLASMFDQYANGGYQPQQQDIDQGASMAQSMFAPQRQALQSNFQDMSIAADRNAARMGRAGNDPILQNKLYQEQSRQMGQLDAQQGAYGRQYAQEQPLQRLNYAQQATNLRSGLASQAMANRQTLLQLGSGLLSQDNNFRVGAASTTQTNSTPGNFLNGALSGAGAGLGAFGMFGGFSGGSGGSKAPVNYSSLGTSNDPRNIG